MTILALTSSCFAIPVICYVLRTDVLLIESIIAICCGVISIVSTTFWINPVRYSAVHILDGLVGKITYVSVCIYIATVRTNNIITTCTILAALIFCISHVISSKCWCSNLHILTYATFHFCWWV